MFNIKNRISNKVDRKNLAYIICYLFMALLLVPFARSYLSKNFGVKYSLTGTILCVAICVIGLVPLYSYIFSKNKILKIPMLAIWGTITVIQHGYRPLVFSDLIYLTDSKLGYMNFIKTLFLVLFSILICFSTYVYFNKKIKNKIVNRNYLNFNLKNNIRFVMIIGLAGNMFYALETIVGSIFYTFDYFFSPGLQQPIHLLAGLPIISIIILYAAQIRGDLSKKEKVLFWSLIFFPRIILGGLTGITFQIAGVLIPIVFIYMYMEKKIPFGVISFFLLIFIIFQGMRKSNLRQNRDYFSEKRYTSNKVDFSIQISKYIELLDRLGGHNTLGLAVKHIPKDSYYYGPKATATAVFVFIPRAIWPNKPRPVDLREFGNRIYVFGNYWYKQNHNVRPTQLGMLYATFGLPAIIIGMIFFGGFYSILENFSCTTSCAFNYGKLLMSSLVASILIDIEGDCFAVLARVAWPSLLVFFLCKFFQWNDRRIGISNLK